MNRLEADILRYLLDNPYTNQRTISEDVGLSIGTVNKALKSLLAEGYLDTSLRLSENAWTTLNLMRPRQAVILAAGFGMRMIPINSQTPKALIEVHGQALIERIIEQLHSVGITEITIVVGFMKEKFDFLIDKYGVELLVNNEYAAKNNLHSLALAADKIENAYIIPGDLWCAENPFRRYELYSWYMVSDKKDANSDILVNRKTELVSAGKNSHGNSMIGIAYLAGREAAVVAQGLKARDNESKYYDKFWEAVLYSDNGKLLVPARIVSAADYVEINTYEQLRELDKNSNQLNSDAIRSIAEALRVRPEDIRDIKVLKKGMTNRSFLFSCRGTKYIMRIPGEGTDKLINRRQEAEVYGVIRGKGLCDDLVYINPDNGYKITRYIENVRTADAFNMADVAQCMEKLRALHGMNLSVAHEFKLFETIDYYETLWNGTPSVYRDYTETKRQVFELKPFILSHAGQRTLCHIDSVADNFLFAPEADGKETLQLTDWEYAGMQDPHIDLAMFCIYSHYNKQQCDRLVDIYFEGHCPPAIRAKIYCYIAACGLLWSNWCEYKCNLGVEFGEYAMAQYRYAKDFYKYAAEQIAGLGATDNV